MEEHNGYSLVNSESTTSVLESPTGVKIASFFTSWGEDMPNIEPLIDGLDCGHDHPTVEHAIRYIVDRYERMTLTRRERFNKRVAVFFSRGVGVAVVALAAVVGAIAAIVAAVASILTYFNTVAPSVPAP